MDIQVRIYTLIVALKNTQNKKIIVGCSIAAAVCVLSFYAR